MRQVRWSDDSLDDLEEQVVHIAKDNRAAARRVAKRIRDTGATLANFATGHQGRVAGTYEKSLSRRPYVIVYALSEDDTALTILRVIHTSRNWLPDDWPE